MQFTIFSWFRSMFCGGEDGVGRGLALYRHGDMDISLINFSVGHVDVRVRGMVDDDWFLSEFYGNPRAEFRTES